MKSKLTILIGLSASGKSTYAYTLWNDDPLNTIIVSRNDIRKLLFGYIPQTIYEYYERPDYKKLEKEVSECQHNLIEYYLNKGKHVIVDNTHLKRNYLIPYFNYGVKPRFLVLHTPLIECLERDKYRDDCVGEDILKKQYKDYNELIKNRLGRVIDDPEHKVRELNILWK